MGHRVILTATLILILAYSKSGAQTITDTATLRSAINSQIVSNGAQQITAAKLNRILNGTLNVMPFFIPHVDTIYQRGDSLFYKKNGIEYFGAITSGGGSYEPTIAPHPSAGYYWNGYKQFTQLNYDSIADGTNYYGWTQTNITPGFGIIGFGATPGKYLQIWADSTVLASIQNARRMADSAANSITSATILPSQTGNSGKYLTTNGSSVSWGTVSSGSGNTNSNIGTGYRAAVPNTNNIKTFFGGYGLNYDSTSNTNGITGTPDTTKLVAFTDTLKTGGIASQSYASTAAGTAAAAVLPTQTGNSGKYLTTNGSAVSWASVSGGSSAPYYYGVLYNKNSWTGTSDFVLDTATASVSSNKIVVTAGSGLSSIDYNYYSLLDHWNNTAKIKATSTSAAAGVGVRSTNVYQNFDIDATVNFATGTLRIVTRNRVAGTPSVFDTVATSASNLTINTNDYILITLERVVDTVYATARDITTGSAFITASFGYLTSSYIVATPNTGRYCVYALNGTFTVDSISITSKELVNANLLVTTDSKGLYTANSFYTRWPQQIAGLYYPTVMSIGGTEGIRDVLNRVPEIIALNPKRVLLFIGRNDVNNSYSYAANYDTVVAQLTRAGITVLHLNGFKEAGGLNLTGLYSFINSGWPGNVIDTYDPSTQVPNLLYSDNVHPNQAGHNLIASTIIQSGLINTGLDYTDVTRLSAPQFSYTYTPTNASGTAAGIVTLANQTLGTGIKTMQEAATSTSFDLPSTSSSTTGVVNINGSPVLHSYGGANIFIGGISGNFTTTGTNETGIGVYTLSGLTSGSLNTAVGYQSLENDSSGSYNTSMGALAGTALRTGTYNTFFGVQAGTHAVDASHNILLGYYAGENTYTNSNGGGSAGYNIMIGDQSGSLITYNGSYNVFIGHNALNNPSAVPNNKLCITGGSATNNLIYGDFNTGQVQINAAQTSPALTSSAALEIVSTNKGLLLPRLTTSQRNSISGPVAGLVIFCTDCTANDSSTGVTETYNGTTWKNNW